MFNPTNRINNIDLFNVDSPVIHTLKINKEYYKDIHIGLKTFEIRFNDRDYKVGDIIQFSVVNEISEVFMQPMVKYLITYILDYPEGLKEEYIVLGIKPIRIE